MAEPWTILRHLDGREFARSNVAGHARAGWIAEMVRHEFGRDAWAEIACAEDDTVTIDGEPVARFEVQLPAPAEIMPSVEILTIGQGIAIFDPLGAPPVRWLHPLSYLDIPA